MLDVISMWETGPREVMNNRLAQDMSKVLICSHNLSGSVLNDWITIGFYVNKLDNISYKSKRFTRSLSTPPS